MILLQLWVNIASVITLYSARVCVLVHKYAQAQNSYAQKAGRYTNIMML